MVNLAEKIEIGLNKIELAKKKKKIKQKKHLNFTFNVNMLKQWSMANMKYIRSIKSTDDRIWLAKTQKKNVMVNMCEFCFSAQILNLEFARNGHVFFLFLQ